MTLHFIRLSGFCSEITDPLHPQEKTFEIILDLKRGPLYFWSVLLARIRVVSFWIGCGELSRYDLVNCSPLGTYDFEQKSKRGLQIY